MAPRLLIYGVLSTLGAASVVGSALRTKPNFFAAAVAVGRSSGAMMILANFALFNTICFGIIVKSIFFGRLRSIEYEHLFERLWLFLTESLLALTIFRDDFSAPFVCMYGLLLFLKCFHWITADRVDFMDQVPPPGPPILFHIRCSMILTLLTGFDLILVAYSLESILIDGVSSMVLFASEFMILLATINGISARYFIGLLDLRRARGREDAPAWEKKSMYLFYVDLAVDFVKLLTYLTFFLVILLNYGLPLHILRDVYMTLRSFLSRCSDLVRYRKATRDMDALYPDATTADLERNGDKTCIICREEMIPNDAGLPNGTPSTGENGTNGGPRLNNGNDGPNETPKKLQCGHIFHFHCLRSWLERQQSCPTCRRDVLRAPMAQRPTNRPPVNVQINPPPPAPGARPNAFNGQNPIQAVYDQYFRPPQPVPPQTQPPAPQTGHQPHLLQQPQQAQATPLPIPTDRIGQPVQIQQTIPWMNGHAGPSNSSLPTPIGSVAGMTTEEEGLQRGIWGGPIIPGRFFATPLGAAPSSDHPIQSVRPYTRSAGSNMAILRLPDLPSAPFIPPIPSSSGDSQPTQPLTDHQSQYRGLFAGSTPITPHTSNPPQIFSTPRSRSGSDTHSRKEIDFFEDTDEGRDGIEQVGVQISEQELRRAVAEAAMKRMAGKIPFIQMKPSQADSEAVELEVNDEGSNAKKESGDVKGKGKARMDDNVQEPRFIPYLTPINQSLPHGYLDGPANGSANGYVNGWRPSASGLALSDMEMSMDGTNKALEERLRTLREVDEALWGLIGELTRVKSAWETTRVKGDREANGREG